MPSLAALRSALRPETVGLLSLVWEHYYTNGKWPACRPIHSKLGKAHIKELQQGLNGSILQEDDESGQLHYRLSIVGVLLTRNGPAYEALMLAYLHHMREVFLNHPEKEFVTKSELEVALHLDEERCNLLQRLVSLASLFDRSSSQSAADWQFGVLNEVEDYPRTGDLKKQLEARILRQYSATLPISYTDRIKASGQTTALHADAVGASGIGSLQQSNPLKRRYQVFVSSTYEDLREERQHAIQALLETKCIPSGMELFPAASTSQWDLIRRVIDDCDYYIVIIAGHYGSIAPGIYIGYTEREFDHALSIKKPIFAFCHKDIELLQGSKLEKSDIGRKRLLAFRAKAESRMCRYWKGPEELASAIKSAIIHAIEYDPQPGWVRATSVLDGQDIVAKQQQRISELKRELAGNQHLSPTRPTTPTTLLTIHVRGHYYTVKNQQENWRSWSDQKPFTRTIEKTWDDVFAALASRLENPISFASLKKTLEVRVAAELTLVLRTETTDPVNGMSCAIGSEYFESILRTLHARDLITQRPCPKTAHIRKPYWILTAAGAKHFAQLQAIDGRIEGSD